MTNEKCEMIYGKCFYRPTRTLSHWERGKLRASRGWSRRGVIDARARPQWQPQEIPDDQEQRPQNEKSHGVRQHCRHDRSDAGTLVVTLGESDHEREV